MAQGITNDTPFQKDVQSAIGGIKKVANSTADMAAEALAKIGAGMQNTAVESAQPGANVGWYYTGKEQPLPAMGMGVENLPQPAKTPPVTTPPLATPLTPPVPVQGEVAKPNPNGIVPDKSWADVVAAANVKQSEPPEAAKGIGQDPEITKAIQEIKANKGNYDRQGNMYSEAEKRIGDLVGHGVTASTSEKTAQLTKGQHTQYEMARLEETKRMNDIHAQDFQLRLAQQKDTATANRTAKLVEDFSFNEQSPSGEKIKNMPLTYYNIGLGGDVPEAIKKPVQDVMNEAEEYVAKRTPPGKKLTPALRQAAIKDWIKAKRIHPEI